jgi:hypothetical protein
MRTWIGPDASASRPTAAAASIRCLRESDEECIALRVDLNTSMADKCLTQRAPMLGEDPP